MKKIRYSDPDYYEKMKEQRQILAEEMRSDNDEEQDDGCPICGSIKCGGYCL